MGMLGNFPYQGLISGDNILDASIGASDLKTGLLSGVKNRIINGGMRVSQRGTSFAAANGYTVDRFTYGSSGSGAATVTQSSDVPEGSGLSNSVRATVTTADNSVASTDYATFFQIIEGYNIADLIGVPLTLSFWVRSSKTGIHCGKFGNSADDRSYVYEYTINTANTWEKKYVTISSGLITDGNWNFTNGKGLLLSWALVFGSVLQTSTTNTWISSNAYSTANQVNCLDTVGNIFAITGVQLEKGSSATDFEFRPYSAELTMCQRYYWKATSPDPVVTGYTTSGARIYLQLHNPVPMRVAPSITFGTFSNFNCSNMEINTSGIFFTLLMATITTTGSGYSQTALQLSAEL